MYTATNAAVGANATSIRNVVNAAISGEIPVTFNGRCFQVTLIASAATIVLSSRGDTTPAAPPPAGNGVPLVANVPFTFQAPTGNQISIDEMYLSGAGTVSIIILVL